jgi:hypothetical protein
MWTFVPALVWETRAQSSSAPFSYTLYILLPEIAAEDFPRFPVIEASLF